MVKKSIDARVRPLANPALEKASLLGAARLYVSKESLIALTNGLESGKPCVVEKLDDQPPSLARREASLWILPEKNLSPNVVMMTRAFQEATAFKIGDQVRISLLESMPDVQEVVVQDVSEEQQHAKDRDGDRTRHPACWEFALSLSMERADLIFPGMVFEGVNINRLRRSFKVVSVNSYTNNIAKFHMSSSMVRISSEEDAASAESEALSGGELVVTGVPGLTAQIGTINRFLNAFTRPFFIRGENESCGFVIHGGHGTGKTFLLQKIADTRWGRPFWIKPTDKLAAIRETFKQARTLQPSIILIDGLEDLIPRDLSNRYSVIDAIGEELDALSAEAKARNALPMVVVIATCLDYMADVPVKLQKRSRLMENIALPIPRASERLEILNYLDPPLHPAEKKACLDSVAQQTHAYNGDDLTNLVFKAKKILGNRLFDEGLDPLTAGEQFLSKEDMEQALITTKPTAMHDINLQPPTIHWRDVGGQESLKKVLSRMISITKNTDHLARRVLRSPPKGLLLYGPPGCSKTLSAQAMATESGFNFFAVKGAELLNMYVGESERAIRTLFERARAASPSIIFFDEIDSIGGQRGQGPGSSSSGGSGAVNMLTTLLTEMDGFESLKGVFVLAATNRPEAIDPALMRPGRFDQVLYVGPPDQAAREAVFNVHLKGLAVADDVDVTEAARLTNGYSGAEIKAICQEAGIAALDRFDNDESGKASLEIGMDDLTVAIERTPRNITSSMIKGYENWSRQFRPR
ncbi:AAA family ATPase [Metarhizium album ARSEF 1941]|uniref:AAA family ATPase n=1 Tax=Metarhizium album (strain ARSEF 1941) TaxID=1081103 RepID=A0A0B2WSQ6_METAS|nr:AAA family ATPase [Metarhizium album ARSEF 1941]KHN97068.1 AAA family ATPase [Metarhizium album ARSEF 1941]